jgi:hypothetical protein
MLPCPSYATRSGARRFALLIVVAACELIATYASEIIERAL